MLSLSIMKTILKIVPAFLITGLLFFSCQKEYSFETGNGSPSSGSLQSAATGECLGISVSGVYQKDSTLNNTHYIDVNVDVTEAGAYQIHTDTVNGFFFSGSGTFAATGVNTVRLQGNGTALASGLAVFTVTYDSTQCVFAINVTGSGSGGTSVFTLNGSPNNCTGAVVNGTYTEGTALDGTNTVDIQVDVTTVGTWSVATTTVNGITFSGSGTFTNTGAQTITLTGSGTPVVGGTFSFPITVGSTTCSFTVTCAAIPSTGEYFPRTANSNWTYAFNGNPQDTFMVSVISPTHAALGNVYNIFMFDVAAGDTAGYYRKVNGNYYSYADWGDFFGFDNSIWDEIIFLKDNVAANTSWYTQSFDGTASGSNYRLRIKFTILVKDGTVTVGGTPYNNTIVVEEKYEAFDGTNWVDLTNDVGYYKTYYARDIGRIKEEYFNSSGALDYEYSVTRYQVF